MIFFFAMDGKNKGSGNTITDGGDNGKKCIDGRDGDEQNKRQRNMVMKWMMVYMDAA